MKYQQEYLAKFANQISHALNQYESHGLEVSNFDNIILSGLGGSGIAGRIAKSYFFSISSLPIEVISDYTLPSYAGKRTLAIMSSYSGNTEETLSMYAAAKAKGCTIVAITTGGQLAESAALDGYKIYNAETGFQPRMALGYSLSYLLLLFGELFQTPQADNLKNTIPALSDTSKFIEEAGKVFGTFNGELSHKMIVVTDYVTNPVGLRFCQQIQENAKAEAFLHELPECNHNVIESYYGKKDSVFFFINSNSNERTSLRYKFLADLLKKNGNNLIELNINGHSLSSILETIYVLDWLSLLIADARKVNSSLIENINALKNYLGKA